MTTLTQTSGVNTVLKSWVGNRKLTTVDVNQGNKGMDGWDCRHEEPLSKATREYERVSELLVRIEAIASGPESLKTAAADSREMQRLLNDRDALLQMLQEVVYARAMLVDLIAEASAHTDKAHSALSKLLKLLVIK